MDTGGSSKSYSVPYTRLYVKNLGDQTTVETLRTLFEPFGAVTSIDLLTDSAGTSRGFGFVNYGDHESAKRAVDELHGKDINGKELYVSRAQKKAEREEELRRQDEKNKEKDVEPAASGTEREGESLPHNEPKNEDDIVNDTFEQLISTDDQTPSASVHSSSAPAYYSLAIHHADKNEEEEDLSDDIEIMPFSIFQKHECQLQKYSKTFQELANNDVLSLKPDEFKAVLAAQGLVLTTDEELEEAFETLACDTIDLEQFVDYMKSQQEDHAVTSAKGKNTISPQEDDKPVMLPYHLYPYDVVNAVKSFLEVEEEYDESLCGSVCWGAGGEVAGFVPV
ncbi:Polyadenylate-binding protein 1-like [Rhizophlyctis rosea]|nr:Polyadenylate-binding protein 1-like [Rhizophlyctis rosea]